MRVAEEEHVARIKSMPCVVCDEKPPSDAHEIVQGQWFTCMPLCRSCHMGSHNGIHGQARIWAVKKMTELSALNETLRRIFS
jgi:hypothetical protein